MKPEQDTNLREYKVIVTMTDPKGVQLEQKSFAEAIKKQSVQKFWRLAKALWWCNGLEDQPLYKVQVSLWITISSLLDSKEYSIGLRELTQSAQREG